MEREKKKEIKGGMKRVDEMFEDRSKKEKEIIEEIDGKVSLGRE